MTIWMNLDWPLLVGGKAFASVPAFRADRVRADRADRSAERPSSAWRCSWSCMGKRGVMYDPRFSDDPDRGVRACRERPGIDAGAAAREAGAVEVRYAAP